jgi:hypothetical protein
MGSIEVCRRALSHIPLSVDSDGGCGNYVKPRGGLKSISRGSVDLIERF